MCCKLQKDKVINADSAFIILIIHLISLVWSGKLFGFRIYRVWKGRFREDSYGIHAYIYWRNVILCKILIIVIILL